MTMDSPRPKKRALSHQEAPAAQGSPTKKAKRIRRGRKKPHTKPATSSQNVQSPAPDWIPHLGLSMLDKTMLQGQGGLRPQLLYAAVRLLKRQFQDKSGLPCIRTVSNCITATTKPTLQFHIDIQNTHAYVTACDGQKVVIADSGNQLGPETYQRIEESYKHILKDPVSKIQRLKTHEQPPNSSECVIHSISNAYELLAPDGNPECYYHQGLMRDHLLQCLESGEITEFPKAYKPYVWSNPPVPFFNWKDWKP